jgi:mannose-6-phosphate isomerase-like protein (cupin superfamily)
MNAHHPAPLSIAKTDGQLVDLGGLGVHFKLWGKESGGRVSIVEHPMQPRRLVPPHVHSMEDEVSYVVHGRFGARIGDEILTAGPGDYIYKPCGVPHTFWNPTDEPALLVEVIAPAGFEVFFLETAEFFQAGGKPGSPEHGKIAERYGLTFFDDWIPELTARFGLKLLGEP